MEESDTAKLTDRGNDKDEVQKVKKPSAKESKIAVLVRQAQNKVD
jgi:hypothetical protein